MPNNLPTIKYSARDFRAIYQALEDRIKNDPERSDLWSSFFESDLGTLLIDLISYIGDLNAFDINRTGEEAFVATAQRFKSMLRHAKSIGYSPRMPSSAVVTVQSVSLPSSAASFPIKILEGASVNIANMTFETLREYNFAAGSTEIEFDLSEGETKEDSFTSEGGTWQRYTTTNESVIGGTLSVFVNGVEWELVQFVSLESGDTQTYSIDVEGDGSATIRFGDGNTGAVPQSGDTITLSYRVGGGTKGNLPAKSANGSITAYINGNQVSIRFTNENAGSGGRDQETVEELRRGIPASIRTMDKGIALPDYVDIALSFPNAEYGAVARASASLREGTLLLLQNAWGSEPNVTIPADTTVTVGAYTFRTFSDMVLNGGNPNLVVDPNTIDVWIWSTTTATDGYETYTQPTDSLREGLLTYLDARSVATVMPVVRSGYLKVLDIDLGTVYVDRRYELSEVEDAIIETIADFFMEETLEPGGSFILSDFYNVLEDVPGVLNFTIQQPVDNVTAENNEMIIRGDITYTLEYVARDVPTSIVGRY